LFFIKAGILPDVNADADVLHDKASTRIMDSDAKRDIILAFKMKQKKNKKLIFFYLEQPTQ
jgi:hypothetical protein